LVHFDFVIKLQITNDKVQITNIYVALLFTTLRFGIP